MIVLPPNAPAASPRHRPGDLRPRPRLAHDACVVVHLAEHDLARLARPGLHDPLVRRGPILGVGLRLRRVAVEPRGDLGNAQERCPWPASRSAGAAPAGGANGVWIEPPGLVVDRLADAWSRPSQARRARGRRPPPLVSSERPELVAHEVERGHEHDRNRLGGHLADAETHEHIEQGEVRRRARSSRRRGSAGPDTRRARAGRETSRGGSRCSCSSPRPGTNRWPRAGSGCRRRGAGQRVDGEVDEVAAGADRAELGELEPVVPFPERAPCAPERVLFGEGGGALHRRASVAATRIGNAYRAGCSVNPASPTSGTNRQGTVVRTTRP